MTERPDLNESKQTKITECTNEQKNEVFVIAYIPFSSNESQMFLQIKLNAVLAALKLFPLFSLVAFCVGPYATNQMVLNCLATQTSFPLEHTRNEPSSSSRRITLNFCPKKANVLHTFVSFQSLSSSWFSFTSTSTSSILSFFVFCFHAVAMSVCAFVDAPM